MGKPRCWLFAVLVGVMAALPVGPVGASPDVPAPPGQVGAAACSTAPTAGTVSRTVGGRAYLLRVPPGLTGPAPLVVSMHGWFSGPAEQEARSGLSTYAGTAGFIVAYPTGTFGHWDHWNRASADLTHLGQVVDDISATWCVERARVHAEGFSMGGSMAGRLACEASDVFASVSGHAMADPTEPWFGVIPSQPCTPSRPVSVFLSCGEADGNFATICTGARQDWTSRLSCEGAGPSTDAHGTITRYRSCDGGTEVVWRTWAGVGHNYPTGAALARLHDEVVDFYERNPLP